MARRSITNKTKKTTCRNQNLTRLKFIKRGDETIIGGKVGRIFLFRQEKKIEKYLEKDFLQLRNNFSNNLDVRYRIYSRSWNFYKFHQFLPKAFQQKLYLLVIQKQSTLFSIILLKILCTCNCKDQLNYHKRRSLIRKLIRTFTFSKTDPPTNVSSYVLNSPMKYFFPQSKEKRKIEIEIKRNFYTF